MGTVTNHSRAPSRAGWVPIRPLGQAHRTQILQHLLGLGDQDRYLRFGYAANDERIRAYAASLDFSHDDVFGIFNRRLQLVAITHLAYSQLASANHGVSRMAEFAVSVDHRARGRGYGGRLFGYAVRHARNRGVDRLFIHALSENTAMLRIARKAGADMQRDGSESEAWLQLPPDSLASQMEELFANHAADLNYVAKGQLRRLQYVWARYRHFQHRMLRMAGVGPR
ncbi:GNAT family N-acetyltransferase [Sphaerotilus sp.]|uniref:GNAT family N-acetyltransferase n=1 Tax=Sphaerotilus sp. TaxID=2093942 RepID=UPI0025ED6FA3|nr:GNAT family N-acetyltransferase [Sphaerotilus sp.]